MALIDDFRAELQAAADAIESPLRGLQDFDKVSISDPLRVKMEHEIEDFTRRRDRIFATLAAIDQLKADDYPNMPKAELTQAEFDELQGQLADFNAAAADFVLEPATAPATGGTFEFPPATPKP